MSLPISSGFFTGDIPAKVRSTSVVPAQPERVLEQAKAMGEKTLNLAVKSIINDLSFTGWTTGGHTASDVQVFAYGKNSDDFVGSQNNTDIAKKLIGYIEQ